MFRAKVSFLAIPAVLATLILAACGGGGGSTPSTPPGLTGALSADASGVDFANAQILFSCGCTGQAGTVTADSAGAYTITAQSSAVPASPEPVYTIVPGRNYVIVGKSTAGAQAWTMSFAGSNPSRNVNLYGQTNTNATDKYTAAAALYVYYKSQNFSGISTYDRWNFNTVAQFAQSLRNSTNGNNAAETKLLNDIVAAQGANQSIFPVIPLWYPQPSATANATIATDLNDVGTSGDAAVPTPCPTSGCTNKPSA